MLHYYCKHFLEYCQLADFSVRSIQALIIRLNELKAFLKSQRIRSVKKITYQHLINFVADHKDPSIHVRKSRVWTLRQIFHFLTLHHLSMGLRNLIIIIIMLLITTKKGFDERITV